MSQVLTFPYFWITNYSHYWKLGQHISSRHTFKFVNISLEPIDERQNSVSLSVAKSIADIILGVDSSYESLLVC